MILPIIRLFRLANVQLGVFILMIFESAHFIEYLNLLIYLYLLLQAVGQCEGKAR